MGFPVEIQLALEQYNHRKEFVTHRFDDHPALQAILNIQDTDKQDPVKLYQCFNKNNEPALSQASFQVYLVILSYFLESLGLISDKKVTVYPKSLEYLDPAFLSVKQETGSENNLWVGLLHWDTFNKQTLLIEERHELLKTAVESLEKQANGKQYLLVAPEYFYSRPLADSFERHIKEVNHKHHSINYLTDRTYSNFYEKDKHYPPGSIRQIEENSYKKILFFLKNLSSQHPNLILFPGTISYMEKIKTERRDLFILKKRIEENLENISFHNLGPSLLFYNFNFKAYFLDKKEEDKIQCLKKFKYVAKNTAPCFYQGKKIFSQNKVYNFSEITEGYPKVGKIFETYTKKLPEIFFLPGVYQGEVGKINDLSFAIDICADHPRLFLKKSLEKKKEPLALHICQSACVKGKLTAQCQSIGGYFIHASSKLEYNTVIKREGEFFYKKEFPYLEEKITVLHTEKNKQLKVNKYEKGQATLSFFKLPSIALNFEETIKDSPKRRMSI